jgi:riboflavin synthase
VSGVCLTVVDRTADTFTVDVMAETLRRSTIGALSAGDEVNLERSVTPTTRLGGHIVQGHVDGTGVLTVRTPHPAYDEIRIAVGRDLARYLAPKGAIAVDGVSLTRDLSSGSGSSPRRVPRRPSATRRSGRPSTWRSM